MRWQINATQRVWVSLCILLGTIAGTAIADSAADWEKMKRLQPKGYVCSMTPTPIEVDGRLDEASWKSAAWTSEFEDIEGDLKPRPRFRTRAKMLWDKDFFYVAALLDEPHVWGTLTEHDSVIFRDNDFEVFIDPDGDNHEYYELELNALNTTWDLFLPKPYKDGGKADNSWEIRGLKTAVHVQGTLDDPTDQDTAWSVEIAIPWDVLGEFAHRSAPPNPGDQWRVNFSRVEWKHEIAGSGYRKIPKIREDNWVWSPQGIIDMHRPERWGYVQFSDKPAGKDEFVPDHALTARDLLMTVYHRQKSFYKQQKQWASSLSSLGLTETPEGFQRPIQLRPTSDGYRASLEIPGPSGTPEVWHVRQDSRLWLDRSQAAIEKNLKQAGENRAELERALRAVPADQLAAMRFLIANMPLRDLESLDAEFLLDNVRLAYQAREQFPFAASVPEEIFFNDVLPYASINERRDPWRSRFLERFAPMVKDAKSLSEAAALLNQKVFPDLKVRYSTQRKRADQSPLESMESGLASCTGLSVLLIDACRAVGVPARFVGTPLWSDRSGNHSWVEVWDRTWHFTGAAEPSGLNLDKAWFVGRASGAKRDNAYHAIYAVSFRRTPQSFPMVWAQNDRSVSAVNVTDRYANRIPAPPEGSALVTFVVRDRRTGERCSAELKVLDQNANEVFQTTTNDERFDANDHVGTVLPIGKEYTIELKQGDRILRSTIESAERTGPHAFFINDAKPIPKTPKPESKTSSAPINQLKQYLDQPRDRRGVLAEQSFAGAALSRKDAALAGRMLWEDRADALRRERAAEMEAKVIQIGDLKMPFTYQLFGKKPKQGRSLYISMHGGGGAPKQVNDQQWENQKRLYRLEEGVYLVPRAPTNTWNLWHQGHIDGFFSRLIENLIVFEDVNPDRVYIMGYSAGGDGVYQLAPRMADQLAAASMMAGHPNETSPLGLRNLPFTIHMGELDSAYNRNAKARQWGEMLAELQQNDPAGYVHEVTMHKGKGHWMDRQDAVAVGWMAKYSRKRFPRRVIWKQDDVAHARFYWLAANVKEIRSRAEVRGGIEGQTVTVSSGDVDRLTIRLSDELIDLDQAVTVRSGGEQVFSGILPRTIGTLATTLSERGDPAMLFSAQVTVVPKPQK